MFRAIFRHIKEAYLGITRHLAMSLSAASAVTVTLLLMSLMILALGNVNQITMNLQENVTIFVRVEERVLEDQIFALQTKVQSVDGVSYVTYSDKDAELDKLIEEFGEDGYLLEAYRGENNPLSRAFIVEIESGYKISNVAASIGKVDGIEEALFGGNTTEKFIESLNIVRIAGFGVVIALGLLAIFLISNTIKITIFARQDEIVIMRHVGATNSYIRTPFVLEGIAIGILGSVIPVLFTIVGYDFLYEAVGGKLITGMLTLMPVFPFSLYVSGILITTSVFVGLFGSWVSVTKNLRWKR